jgi:nucleobase:cation symporter-1, NCS1 family
MLGSFDGIAIADYWLVRQTRIDLAQLYTPGGRYAYTGGLNPRAVIAVLVGWGLALLGLLAPPLHVLWSGGWIFSLLGGLIAYWLLMRTEASVLTESEYDAITESENEPLAKGA